MKHKFLMYRAFETRAPHSYERLQHLRVTDNLAEPSEEEEEPILFAGVREVERFVREQNANEEAWVWDYELWSPDTEQIFKDLGWKKPAQWIDFSHTHEVDGGRYWAHGWTPDSQGWGHRIQLQLVLAGPTKRRRYWVGQSQDWLYWTVE